MYFFMHEMSDKILHMVLSELEEYARRIKLLKLPGLPNISERTKWFTLNFLLNLIAD